MRKKGTMKPIPWEELYCYIYSCGSLHDIEAFSVEVLNGLGELVEFDRGVVFFVDANQKIQDHFLLNIKDSWANMYLDYYSKARISEYSIQNRAFRERPNEIFVDVINWDEQPLSDFVRDYIKAQNLRYSLGFVLFDLNGFPRISFALDRMTNEAFSEDDLNIIRLIQPSLNNLHKNFYASATIGSAPSNNKFWEEAMLTEREIEVTNLLCQGLSPSVIGEALHISTSTVNKHIAHIYDKMKVSTIQELLVKVLKSSS